MDIYCKRTMFNNDEKIVVCAKGKVYQTKPPSDFESKTGICLWVNSEIGEDVPLTLKVFDKFFTTIDEMRNMKINEVLK